MTSAPSFMLVLSFALGAATTWMLTRQRNRPSSSRQVVLLPAAERIERLKQLVPSLLATVGDETDIVAIQSTIACMLWDTLIQTNWCGFYRVCGPDLLKVGPYQGSLGCLRIHFSRGVCGAACTTRQVQLVPNVHDFPGHIACDGATQSELVIPVVNARNELIAVLDMDSTEVNGFCWEEAQLLQQLLNQVFCK